MRRAIAFSVVVSSVLSAVVTVLVLGAAGSRHADAQPGEIQAQLRTLVGRNGTPRLVLGETAVAGLAGAGLVVLGQDGRTPRFALGESAEGPAGLIVFGSDGTPRIELAEDAEGGVGLTGRDRTGAIRFEMFYTGEDFVAVRVRDHEAKIKAAMFQTDNGGSALSLRDARSVARTQLQVGDEGPQLLFMDEDELPFVTLP